MAHQHQKNLTKLCRICGKLVSNDVFSVVQNAEMINKCFYIITGSDDINIHPGQICMKCYSNLNAVEKRSSTTKHFNINWQPHHSDDCFVCNQIKILSKGGRPKKIKRSGRPSGCASPNQLWTRQNSLNLKSTVPTNLKNLSSINLLDFDDDLVSLAVFPICNKIVL